METLLSSDQLFYIRLGDCITAMSEMPSHSVDACIYSPPFPTLYAYSNDLADIGNSEDLKTDAKLHLGFFYRQLCRVVKPGRVVVVHVMQIPRLKRSGGEGLCDFRGLNIRLAERAGLIFEYDWVILKNPQAQAMRTRARELQFLGLESDRAQSRGVLPDYLLKFTAPGDNAVPVDSVGDVSRNDWISWAEAAWTAEKYQISLDPKANKAFTLNTEVAKGPDDTRHVCPLQLSIVDRLVRLYTNPGEIVFSPFAGIGSEGFPAIRRGRRFYGIELKKEYRAAAIENLGRALKMCEESQVMLWDLVDSEAATLPCP